MVQFVCFQTPLLGQNWWPAPSHDLKKENLLREWSKKFVQNLVDGKEIIIALFEDVHLQYLL